MSHQLGSIADTQIPAAKLSPVIGWIASLVVYSAFAMIVFIVQGDEPPLMIDHLAYMQYANEIIRSHAEGDYWRSISDTQSYGVVLAYLLSVTGSYVLSLKWLLVGMTIAGLLAFEVFISACEATKWQALLFALLSGLFVTFGASFWGYTDFSASVQRSAMVPFILMSVWFWLRNGDRTIRFAVFPILVALTVVHLSAYYTIVVLGLVEVGKWAFVRRFRVDRELQWFVGSFVVSCVIRYLLGQLGVVFRGSLSGLVVPAVGPMLDPATAWKIELMAFPWRNLPLPLTTIATIAGSYGLIFLTGVVGVIHARRIGFTKLDRQMLMFAGATVLLAYGPQTILWIMRQFMLVYPWSLEETRAINLIMIPSLYFAFRLFRSAWLSGSKILALVVAVAIVLQPIALLRFFPIQIKEKIVQLAISNDLINSNDSLRLLYARHLLGLQTGGPRFYYSARGVIDWFDANVPPGTRVISTLNELILARVERIGPFNGLLEKPVAAVARKEWADAVFEVDDAISFRDTARVERVARKYRAEFAVVPWVAPEAIYKDIYYSIIRVTAERGG